MRYPEARWNPAPTNCYSHHPTRKIAVCNHHMAGYAGYLREHRYWTDDKRRISAHFTVAQDGSVEQHVDTAFVAWTQGIKKPMYPFARDNWPLFQERNPNADCIGIENEDKAKGFSADHPMPDAQLDALLKLHRWLFENVITLPTADTREGPGKVRPTPSIGRNVIGHMHLTSAKPTDPGDWLMDKLRLGLRFTPPIPEEVHVPSQPPMNPTDPNRPDDTDIAALIKRIDDLEHALEEHYHKGTMLSGKPKYE